MGLISPTGRPAPPWCCEFGALGKNFDHIQLSTELPGQSDIGSGSAKACAFGALP